MNTNICANTTQLNGLGAALRFTYLDNLEEGKIYPWGTWQNADGSIRYLEKQETLNTGVDSDESHDIKITINPKETLQTMKGFGGSMTNSAAYLLNQAPNSAICALFSKEHGIGLSYVRVPMGGTDANAEPTTSYSYQEERLKTYLEMAEDLKDIFDKYTVDKDIVNINSDIGFIIPTLQKAKSINPDIKMMMIPWAPPKWMQTSEHGFNAKYMDNYVDYFVKVLKDYHGHGLSFDAVGLQNEPLFYTDAYQSLHWDSDTYSKFAIKLFAGFKISLTENITPNIIIWDHNYSDNKTDEGIANFPKKVLENKDANAATYATAWHCYDANGRDQYKQAFQAIKDSDSEKKIYATECTGNGDMSSENFISNLKWNTYNWHMSALKNGNAEVVLRWNLALDENHGPVTDNNVGSKGCTNCNGMVTINSTNNEPIFKNNADFFSIAHFSKFVPPGSKAIETNLDLGSQNGEWIDAQAFIYNNTVSMVLLNGADRENKFYVDIEDQDFEMIASPNSLMTYVWVLTTAEHDDL
ncbi:MAG: glucosylceramidase [Candidatus Midichloriaceae bacterium]|jgi:glucosylceramidase